MERVRLLAALLGAPPEDDSKGLEPKGDDDAPPPPVSLVPTPSLMGGGHSGAASGGGHVDALPLLLQLLHSTVRTQVARAMPVREYRSRGFSSLRELVKPFAVRLRADAGTPAQSDQEGGGHGTARPLDEKLLMQPLAPLHTLMAHIVRTAVVNDPAYLRWCQQLVGARE